MSVFSLVVHKVLEEAALSKVFAALAGSFVGVALMPKMTFMQGMIAFMGGFFIAFYGTPAIFFFFGYDMADVSPDVYSGVGFLVGTVGMVLFGGFMNVVKSIAEDPIAWLKVWRGK